MDTEGRTQATLFHQLWHSDRIDENVLTMFFKRYREGAADNINNGHNILVNFINSENFRLIVPAIRATYPIGSINIFGLMYTSNWIKVIGSMGYQPDSDTFDRRKVYCF